MKRVVVDHFGGPEVLKVVEEEDPRPGPGEVLVKVLAAGVSFTDSQLRAGTYLPGAPKPPFTPGYELVGVVEELGPGCSRLRAGDRIGALTVWGADAERVCVPESGAVDVPEDLDPHIVTGIVEAKILGALFEPLVIIDPTTFRPTPALAERWERSLRTLRRRQLLNYVGNVGRVQPGQALAAALQIQCRDVPADAELAARELRPGVVRVLLGQPVPEVLVVRRGAQLVGVATGGMLGTMAHDHAFPCVVPAGGLQPRAAFPYLATAALGELVKWN